MKEHFQHILPACAKDLMVFYTPTPMEINVQFNFKLEDKLIMQSEILKLCAAVSDYKEKHDLLDESLVETMAATTLEESKEEWIMV